MLTSNDKVSTDRDEGYFGDFSKKIISSLLLNVLLLILLLSYV